MKVTKPTPPDTMEFDADHSRAALLAHCWAADLAGLTVDNSVIYISKEELAKISARLGVEITDMLYGYPLVIDNAGPMRICLKKD